MRGFAPVRSLKLALAALCALVLTVTTFAAANAFISGSSGNLILLGAPPPSVALNAYENPSSAVAFDEVHDLTLTAPLVVDIATPGHYSSFPVGHIVIPAGTHIDSHLLHSDLPPSPFTPRRAGSLTFNADVLGVIDTTKNLAASDAAVGAPGTTYAGKASNRGFDNAQDGYTLSDDLRTLSFDLQTNPNGMDELRVITFHKNNLVTTVSDNRDPVQAGDHVTYTVTVTNNELYSVPAVKVADQFPGATGVSANAAGGCTTVSTTSTCTLGTLAPGTSGTATIVVATPDSVPVGGTTLANNATSPPNEDPTVTESTDVVSPVLDTVIADAPDPVTVDNNVQYVLEVTNNGLSDVADAHVTDTLPPGTTLISSQQPDGFSCSGSGPVDCALGPIAVGESASAQLVVQVPGDADGITDTAVASPGNNADANEVTTVVAAVPGETRGFVGPGDSLGIDSPNPAVITLPPDTAGAPVVITQDEGGVAFCGGSPCDGTTTTISSFDGYDANHPIALTLIFTFDNIQAAGDSYAAAIWKSGGGGDPGTQVTFCDTPGAGKALPSPCIEHREITEPVAGASYVVTFKILYVSGDPRFGQKVKKT